MSHLFPAGVEPYVLGGLVLGLGIGLVYLTTGRIAGISSFFSAVHTWWSPRIFRDSTLLQERIWKSVLVLGLVLGAGVWALTVGEPFTTHVSLARLFLGGILVGYGTRTARGCTSGHGICGLSAGAPPSFASTATFMGVAILTAHVVGLPGGAV